MCAYGPALSQKSSRSDVKKRIPAVIIVLIVVFGVILLFGCLYAYRIHTVRKGKPNMWKDRLVQYHYRTGV